MSQESLIVLKQFLRERFIVSAALNKLQNTISETIRKNLYAKYEHVHYTAYGMEYELYRVTANLYMSESEIEIDTTRVRLFFTAIIKTDKQQRQAINNAKRQIDQGWCEISKAKKPLWVELTYTLDTEEAFTNKTSLNLTPFIPKL